MRGELEAHGEEFLARTDRAENVAPDLLGRLDLASDLARPVMGHVAIGAGGAHAGAVGIVDGRLQLLKDVVAHLVAADAELFGVGDFHRSIEASPEHDPRQKPTDGQEPEAERPARRREDCPVLEQFIACRLGPVPQARRKSADALPERLHGIGRRCAIVVGNAHFFALGWARRSVSTSMKRLATGGFTGYWGT